ncbi:MAG: histidine phosphatase family protein [Microbacteriaceae bacterium]|nr:histidine phosphatase family protein [Microbacteriaceae bacterium]
MTQLYLVRHGETDWNVQRRIQGSTDIPLNDNGRRQAKRTARLLAAGQWDAVFTSPLSRAHETATIITGELQLPAPQLLPAVVERRYGDAEGLDFYDVEARFPDGVHVPGRELPAAVVQRALPALTDLARQRPAQRIIVVTHGGVIRALLNAVVPEVDRFVGVLIANGSVHHFHYSLDALELVAFDNFAPTMFGTDSGADDRELAR